MPTSQELIRMVQERVLQFQDLQLPLSEADTRRTLIDPIFSAIGWDMEDPATVRREWRKNPNDRPVDYAFIVNGTPKLLVEAERLRESISDKKWEDQLLWYSSKLGIRWCALTNGNIVRMYNSLAEEAAPDKLLFEIEIRVIDTPAGLPIDTFMERLYLLSEESVREGKIDEVWDRIYTVRKVFDYLNAEKDGLVDNIVKRARLSKKSVSGVIAEIVQLRELLLEKRQEGVTGVVGLAKQVLPEPKHETVTSVDLPDYAVLFDSIGKPVNYKGREISSFWFKGTTRSVRGWRTLLFELINIIKDRHEDEFEKVLSVKGFTRKEDHYKYKEEVYPGIFVGKCWNVSQIIERCGILLSKFGYSYEDIKVKVREK